MFGLKKQLIKSFVNIKVVGNKPGELIIQSNALSNIGQEFNQYDIYVKDLVKLLDGIEDVSANYNNNTVTIKYNTNKLTPQKVVRWIDTMIDVAIDNLELIQEFGQTRPEYVAEVLRKVLIQKLGVSR